MKLFARKRFNEVVDDNVLVVAIDGGFAVRLWRRFEKRYAMNMDEHQERLWRRWFVVRWRQPRTFFIYFV